MGMLDTGPSGADMAAVVADHAFFQYERTLQREYDPELIVHLPLSQSLPPTDNAGPMVNSPRIHLRKAQTDMTSQQRQSECMSTQAA